MQWHVLRGLLAVLAPLLPHLAEDAWLALSFEERPVASVFEAAWPEPAREWASGLTPVSA